MPLPRLHLFEFNDSPWTPAALRETVVEALSATLVRGRILASLVPAFRRFIAEAGAEEVLDLCSGAGGPAAILAGELERDGGHPMRFVLTDLAPHVETWRLLRREHPRSVDFVPDPIDATRIPKELGAGRARVIINALHHFKPEVAASILLGASQGSPGVFVAEGFERNPLRFASFFRAGLPALLMNPLRSPRHKLAKACFTWLTPASLAVAVWDGFVSTMRVYTEDDLRKMVAPLDGWRWTYGTYDFAPFGRGYYFYGVPED